MEPKPPGVKAAWSRSRLEPPYFAWSWSWLRDLGFPEPEPPKKVAAPQHCFSGPRPATTLVLMVTCLAEEQTIEFCWGSISQFDFEDEEQACWTQQIFYYKSFPTL